MKIPCELYYVKDGVRGELIGTFEDIEAAQAYITDVCTKLPFMKDSRFQIHPLSNETEKRKWIHPCPVCGNDSLCAHEIVDRPWRAKIQCRDCDLTVSANATAERYVQVYGNHYRKYPAKSAVDVVIDLWNAMAKGY